MQEIKLCAQLCLLIASFTCLFLDPNKIYCKKQTGLSALVSVLICAGSQQVTSCITGKIPVSSCEPHLPSVTQILPPHPPPGAETKGTDRKHFYLIPICCDETLDNFMAAGCVLSRAGCWRGLQRWAQEEFCLWMDTVWADQESWRGIDRAQQAL